jgi:hypothetical protein
MVDGEGRRGASARSRILVGSAALALGCFLVGDAGHRAEEAAEAVAAWWPWALLALAALNLLRSMVAVNSLIGPAVLAVAALCGLAVAHGLDGRTVQDFGFPLVLVGFGIALLGAARHESPRTRWSRFLSTGRVRVPASGGELLALRAVCGELQADLAATRAAAPRAVHLTAVAGHIRLFVPRSWQIRVHRSGALLTRVVETGPAVRSESTDQVELHLLGICGAITISYA